MRILIIIILLSCQNNIKQNSNFLITCFKTENVHLYNNLMKFETYLVKNKYIENTSRKSYIELINSNKMSNINIVELNEYIFNGVNKMYYFNPIKKKVFIKCIKNSGIMDSNEKYFSNIYKILNKSEIISTNAISKENNLRKIYKKNMIISIEKITDNEFSDEFLHLCFLWDLYPVN